MKILPFHSSSRAFSLVEVTLALGMVTFCMLGLVGLLPLGLNAAKTSRDNSMATSALVSISDAIHGGHTAGAGGTAYRAAGKFADQLDWTLGGQTQEKRVALTASGLPASGNASERYAAHVKITPPASPNDKGTATVTVAWPAQATWDADKGEWKNAQGSVRTWLTFLPKVQ